MPTPAGLKTIQCLRSENMQSEELSNPLVAFQKDLCGLLVGRETLVERLIIALLTRGHVLIEGAPGLAKTRSVKLFATGVAAGFSRIQFTPDLLPSDLTGTQVYMPNKGAFDFHAGPLFSNIVLIDEVNRAPPKVQSALLEVMAEQQITVGGETRNLEDPFMVVATQNSIEHEGTYPLPEAQLDRFLFTVELDLPSLEEEQQILELALSEAPGEALKLNHQVTPGQLQQARQAVSTIYVSPAILRYISELTCATRKLDDNPLNGSIEYPASPRASIGMAMAGRARAWLAGRDHVLPEDVFELAPDILCSRIGLSYRAKAEGAKVRDLIANILRSVAPV